MQPYQIIYLNGPSSSGKTTLAKALQDKLEQPFLHISLDKVIGMMPAKLNNWEGGFAPDGFCWKQSLDASGHEIHDILLGPFAEKIVQALKEIVLALAASGHFIIIDDVAFGLAEVDLWREALQNFKVLWIGINAPLTTLEERENSRGNRIVGSARAQYHKVHDGVSYDLKFDTSKDSLEHIIHIITKQMSRG